jgi:hypothetical protein
VISKLAIENQLPLCVSKTQFVIAIRASDPVRARALFEQGLKGSRRRNPATCRHVDQR